MKRFGILCVYFRSLVASCTVAECSLHPGSQGRRGAVVSPHSTVFSVPDVPEPGNSVRISVPDHDTMLHDSGESPVRTAVCSAAGSRGWLKPGRSRPVPRCCNVITNEDVFGTGSGRRLSQCKNPGPRTRRRNNLPVLFVFTSGLREAAGTVTARVPLITLQSGWLVT